MKKRRILWIVIAIVVLAVAVWGFLSFRQAQAAAQNMFQTVPLERGTLTAIVGVTGMVRANQTTTLSWEASGRIGEIHVELDEAVKAGQVLAELEESSLSQSIILARSDLVSAQRSLEELKDSDLARSQAYQEFVTAEKELDDAVKRRANKDYSRASNALLEKARGEYYLASKNVEDALEIFGRVEHFAVDDQNRNAALVQLSDARIARDKKLAALNWYLARPDSLEVASADAEVEVAQARLKDAEREWERLKNGPDPEDVRAAEARVAAIQATLGLAKLEAPISGVVTQVNSMAGDQVSPGSASFRIDDLSHLLVDVEVTEVDINRVQVGQPARLTFDAILGKEYNGIVTQVARVGISNQGVVNFTVTIELTDADSIVRPGMTAAVNIVVNQLEDVLLVPNRAVRLRNGQRVVYVLKNGFPQPVEIELGSSSDSYSELVSGDVNAGDLIVLNPPSEAGGFIVR